MWGRQQWLTQWFDRLCVRSHVPCSASDMCDMGPSPPPVPVDTTNQQGLAGAACRVLPTRQRLLHAHEVSRAQLSVSAGAQCQQRPSALPQRARVASASEQGPCQRVPLPHLVISARLSRQQRSQQRPAHHEGPKSGTSHEVLRVHIIRDRHGDSLTNL